MNMQDYPRFRRFTRGYLRWRKQLTALGEGNLRMVRSIAREAHFELKQKTFGAQLKLVH